MNKASLLLPVMVLMLAGCTAAQGPGSSDAATAAPSIETADEGQTSLPQGSADGEQAQGAAETAQEAAVVKQYRTIVIPTMYESVTSQEEADEIVPAEGFAKSKVIAKYDLRYKEALGDASIPLTMDIAVSDPDGSSANLDLAAGIAAYGMMLRQTRYQGSSSFAMAHELVSRSIRNSAGFDPYQLQLRENLLELIDKADRIKYED